MIGIATRTATGDRGEDRLAVYETQNGAVIVVADGAGGMGGAAVAAQTMCDFIMDRAKDAMGEAQFWATTLRDADVALAATSHGGQTTAVVIEIIGQTICGASVGDSGAWVITEKGIVDLTASQSRKPLIGSGASQPVTFDSVFECGRVLIASDGIFKYAHRETLAACALIETLDDAVTALIDAVRLRNGRLQDDVAVVLCDVPG